MDDENLNFKPPSFPTSQNEVTGAYLKLPELGWLDVIVKGERGEYDSEYNGKISTKLRLEVTVKEGATEQTKVWDLWVSKPPISPKSLYGQICLIRLALNQMRGVKTLMGQKLRITNGGEKKYRVNLLNVAGDLDVEVMRAIETGKLA